MKDELTRIRQLRHQEWLKNRNQQSVSLSNNASKDVSNNISNDLNNNVNNNVLVTQVDVEQQLEESSPAMAPAGKTSGQKRKLRDYEKGEQPVSSSSCSVQRPSKLFREGIDEQNVVTNENDAAFEGLSVLSWNVDGLMEQEIVARTMAVIDHIRRHKPAIIFLQEVTAVTQKWFTRYLSRPYVIVKPAHTTNWCPPNVEEMDSRTQAQPYYCLILVSKYHFKDLNGTKSSNKLDQTSEMEGETYYFPNSRMGRHLLKASFKTVDGPEILFSVATAHLESLRENQEERKEQLSTALQWMTMQRLQDGDRFEAEGKEQSEIIIFGGDLNVRDNEVNSMKDYLNDWNIYDLWEVSGRKKDIQYTWDAARNKNIDGGRKSMRYRFDRLFYWKSEACPLKLETMDLVGTEVLEGLGGMNPSDHFGVLDISSSTVEARKVTTACSELIASFKQLQNHFNSIQHLKSVDDTSLHNEDPSQQDHDPHSDDKTHPNSLNFELFPQALHEEFLTKPFLLEELPHSLSCLSASLVWIVYWCLHGLYLMGKSEPFLQQHGEALIAFISSCQDPELGGFGGGPGQLPHIVSTYAAVASLVIIGTKEAAQVVNRVNLRKFILSLKTPEGTITVHSDGEFDMRGMYCAVASASMAGIADDKLFEGVAEYIASCQRYDGGIAGERGGESHAGFTFCGLAALSLLDMTDLLDLERLLVWLSNRQTVEGGFNGRPEKVVDACYSFWASACFPLIKSALFQRCSKGEDSVMSYPPQGYCWMSPISLEGYVLLCCQPGLTKIGHIGGGICDKPGTSPDFYHTCYALSGLSIVSEWCAAEIEQLSSIGISKPGCSSDDLHPVGPLGDMILRGSPKLERTCPLLNVGFEAQKRYNKTCQEFGICGIVGKGIKAFDRFRQWETDPNIVDRDSTLFTVS